MVDQKLAICAYTRVASDPTWGELSMVTQKAKIEAYVHEHFPGSRLDFFEDYASGYTFDREKYRVMRRKLIAHEYDLLIVRDLSRVARYNGGEFSELEVLHDNGIRIVSIADGLDTAKEEDWFNIQILFLMKEWLCDKTARNIERALRELPNE